MTVTIDDLQAIADRLSDALDVYDRFVEEWLYERGSVPSDVEASLADRSEAPFESQRQLAVALAAAVTEVYHEAREAEATYVQRARERGRRDWSSVVAETAPVRQTARRVHTTGYVSDPETGEHGYQVPEELCPARRVSMNAGSSSVVYEDRVAQYRALADRFGFAPDVVYHPGSGHDVSPSAAFSGSQVHYVDVDAAAMGDLRRAGYRAHGADATGYELANGADVIVFRNAGLVEEAIVSSNLRSGGWVIANDHLESARHLTHLEWLDLVGVVPDEWSGESPTVQTGDHTDSLYRDGSPLDCYVFRGNG